MRDLIDAFTALRHEIKLQTKSARQSQEQLSAAMSAMQAASESISETDRLLAERAEEITPDIVETLMNLDDALARGHAAIVQTCRRLTRGLPRDFRRDLNSSYQRQPWYRRWATASLYRAVDGLCRSHLDESLQGRRSALVQGYELVQERLARALAEADLVRIESLGRSVDPHEMTVVEVVADSDRAPGEVVEVVRRGYRWRDRIVRFAEVRAAARIESSTGGEADAASDANRETNFQMLRNQEG